MKWIKSDRTKAHVKRGEKVRRYKAKPDTTISKQNTVPTRKQIKIDIIQYASCRHLIRQLSKVLM